jgi:hypothetical protein
MRRLIQLAIVLALFGGLVGCDDAEEVLGFFSGGSAPFPTAPDSFEGDDTAGTASEIEVAEFQERNIYPDGDLDWVAVFLLEDVEYEISSSNLSLNGDSYLYLFDTDGTTEIDSNDDWVNVDSALTFTPPADGIYYIRVQTYDSPGGVVTYTLNVHAYIDLDDDGYSTYHDCDDGDDTVYPWADQILGDGIDQACTGTDWPASTTEDAFEDDDTVGSAVQMVAALGSYWEIVHRDELYVGNMRTIHDIDDVDWLKVTIPAHGYIYVDDFTLPEDMDWEWFEADGTTSLGTDQDQYNDTDSPVTIYMRVQYAAAVVTYSMGYADYGVDLDDDGFYTQDWSGDRDCDDSDPDINPDADDLLVDGVDNDCDGEDGNDD